MLRKFILNLLDKLFFNINKRIKISIEPKSPADFYFEEVSKACYEEFKENFKNSFVFSSDNSIREFAINRAIKKFDKNNLFLEFGVYKGESINLFAKNLKKNDGKIYGFDSFQGLKDEWIIQSYHSEGTFDLKNKKPKTQENVELIGGWVEKTVENFLKKHPEKKIAFVHFDMDTYSSTAFVIKKINNHLQPDAILLFDNYYAFPNWQNYEHKALLENIDKDKFNYIALGKDQACIKII